MAWLRDLLVQRLTFVNVWRCYFCGHGFKSYHISEADRDSAVYRSRSTPGKCPKCRMRNSYIIHSDGDGECTK